MKTVHDMKAWLSRAPLPSVLVAIAVWATASTIWSLAPRRALAERPGFEDAMAALASEDAGSFVVVTPPEETAALDAVPKHLHASDAFPAKEAARNRWSSILVVGPKGADVDALGTAVERRTFGEVDLVRYGNPNGEQVLFDLERDLSRVQVSLVPKEGAPIACDVPSDGGFACQGRPSWNHVGPAHLTVNGVSWPCTWAHPVTDYDLVIALGEVELGDRLTLEAALDDGIARNGAAVELELRVGDQVRRLVRSPAPGVLANQMPTNRGEQANVTLVVRTAQDGQRHFGVRLRLTAKQQ